jgi:hypothetical protein
VHAVPFSEKVAGSGLLPLHAPVKPIDVDAPVPSDPFQLALAAVTRSPACVQAALQPWFTFWPALGKSNASVQLVMAEPRFVMPTFALNPPGHWLCTV